MFFWGMLTGCAVVCVGSIVASLIMNYSNNKKKKGKTNVSNDQKKTDDKPKDN